MAETVWIDTLHGDNLGSGSQSVIELRSSSVAAGRGMTLLRTIICHDYSYTIHDSGEGTQVLDIGIGVGSVEAVTAGVVPDAKDELEFPTVGWVYRCRHVLHGFAADQAAIDVRTVYRDLRGRRKLGNGKCYLVWDNTPSSGVASSINMTGITRQLWQLA